MLRKISTKKYAYGRGVYALQEERAAAELGGVSVAEVVRQMKGWSGPRKRHEHNKAKKTEGMYDIGSWVEVRETDMKWQLAKVVASHDPIEEGADDRHVASSLFVLKREWEELDAREAKGQSQQEDGQKGEAVDVQQEYEKLLRSQTDVSIDGISMTTRNLFNIRWPLEALLDVYGEAPFIFQQVLLLLAEKRMRFQADHRHDFVGCDWNSWALREFDAWIENHDRDEIQSEERRSKKRKAGNQFYNAAFSKHFNEKTSEGQRMALRKGR